MERFFSEKEIAAISGLKDETLEYVIYHVWTNVAKQGEMYECLDWLELRFKGMSRIFLTAGEESDGIKVINFDLAEKKKEVAEQFGGQIEIRSYIMNEMELWKPAINLPIEEVKLHQIKETVLNDEIILKFDTKDTETEEDEHQILIGLAHDEGLTVELHEDFE